VFFVEKSFFDNHHFLIRKFHPGKIIDIVVGFAFAVEVTGAAQIVVQKNSYSTENSTYCFQHAVIGVIRH